MKNARLFHLLLALICGCGGTIVEPEAQCASSEDCPADLPVCMASTGTCVDSTVTVCEVTEDICVDGDIVSCTAGESAKNIGCDYGCAAGQCQTLVVSNGLSQFFGQAADSPDPEVRYQRVDFDTDNGVVVADGRTLTSRGIALAGVETPVTVFAFRSFDAHEVHVTGRAAIAIVSDGPMQLSGDFHLNNSGYFSGNATHRCGAAWPADECNAALHGLSGGGQSNYGSGGNGRSGYKGAAAYAADDLLPLRGGCSSRSGGAVQLVSGVSVTISGAILAMGAGGETAVCSNGTMHATGGGAGGSVLIEAPNVSLSQGGIFATGGSGACLGQDGATGEAGAADRPGPNCGPAGGRGGSGAGQLMAGGNGLGSGGGIVGAGGGGIGVIRINTLSGAAQIDGAMLAPAPIQGTLGVQ